MNAVTAFWLVHIFIGIIVPIFTYTGCCNRSESKDGTS